MPITSSVTNLQTRGLIWTCTGVTGTTASETVKEGVSDAAPLHLPSLYHLTLVVRLTNAPAGDVANELYVIAEIDHTEGATPVYYECFATPAIPGNAAINTTVHNVLVLGVSGSPSAVVLPAPEIAAAPIMAAREAMTFPPLGGIKRVRLSANLTRDAGAAPSFDFTAQLFAVSHTGR